jgi:short subunit dehydrogenase-like uncharacterized protein
MSIPTHDLVAFGATSFVGKILCRYLLEEFGAQGKMKWAAAGRSNNTRIVQRTNVLCEQAYGADFTYDEAILMGHGLKGRFAATAMAVGLYGFMLAAAIRPARAALERFVLPKPGEGPSPEAQRKGFFDLRFLGTTVDGRQIRTKVTGDRDPGYGSTGKMLGQAAACLSLDVDKGATPGGFWTPATIFGDCLIQRLTAHSGLTFELVPDLPH